LTRAAGNGDALSLAAREGDAPLSDHRVVAFGEGEDLVVYTGYPGGVLDLRLCGLRVAEGDVLPHRLGEQKRLLRHHPHASPELPEVQLPDVYPAYQDRTFVRVVEARDKGEQRGLTAPRRPDHGHRLAGLDLEGDAVQDGLSIAVREVDPP
jgi:hypothetical protein